MIITLLLSSCTGESSYSTIENNIVGTWKVDEVKYKRKGGCYNDVTPKFDSYKFIFNYDYTMQFIDTETGEDHDGYWYVDEQWTWDPDDQQEEVETTVVISIYNAESNDTRMIYWKEMFINRSRIKTKEKRNNGTYKWKLISQ
jgi:hypothetical protein